MAGKVQIKAVYKDVVASEGNPTTTGDTQNIYLWVMLLCVGLATTVFLVVTKKNSMIKNY